MKRAGFRERKASAFFITVLGALIALWVVLVLSGGRNSPQLSLFFQRMGDFLADFQNVVGYSAQRDPYNNTVYTGLSEKGYPPLVYAVFYLFSGLVDMDACYQNQYFLNMYQTPSFLLVWALGLVALLMMGYALICTATEGSRVRKSMTALVILFSGPMLFTIERGNVVLCAALLTLAFTVFYRSENRLLRETALLCLAVAAGLKLTPAVMGLLLVRERMWKEAGRTMVYGLLFFFGPFLLLRGGMANLPLLLRNMGYMIESYKNTDGCSFSSLFVGICGHFGIFMQCGVWTNAATILCVLGLMWVFFSSSLSWLQMTALTLIVIVTPSFSHYYNVLFLIPALVLFLNKKDLSLLDGVALFALLMIMNPLQAGRLTMSLNYRLGIIALLLYVFGRAALERMETGVNKRRF